MRELYWGLRAYSLFIADRTDILRLMRIMLTVRMENAHTNLIRNLTMYVQYAII